MRHKSLTLGRAAGRRVLPWPHLVALWCAIAAMLGPSARAMADDGTGGFARLQGLIEHAFGRINDVLSTFIFYPVPVGAPFGLERDATSMPLVVCVLVVGGIFFTFRYGWVNVRLFRHGLDVVRGRYTRPGHAGEVSHFKALTSALSATVGLGNIAGVAVAINMGGPGAVFWMWVMAVFGMSMKFSSCTFSQLYRRIKPDGRVLGGPMVYLREGIAEQYPSFTFLAKAFAVVFCICTIFASFGGGNLFQGNQTYAIFVTQFYYHDGVLARETGALAVSADPGEPRRLRVAPGDAAVLTRIVSLEESVLTETIPPAQNEGRIDLVQLTVAGAVNVKSGIEALSPAPPLPDKGAVPLARVRVAPGTAAFTTTDLEDARPAGATDEPAPWVPFLAGLCLAIPVGLVILGGIKRIGEVTSRLVPAMCGFHCVVCLLILIVNIQNVPAMFVHIFVEAFRPDAAIAGGFVGVLVQGLRRAAFSNEAGLGSSSIAHAAAKTNEPVREGVVAMLEPFIDTICVCTMTALAILVTNSHLINPDLEGVQITALAFSQLGVLLPYFLMVAVFVFAFSTVISWGYYGERATEYLFGEKAIVGYRCVYVTMVVMGPVLSLAAIIDFSDLLLLSMAFPNILGMMLISGRVKRLTDDYIQRLRSGDMHPVVKADL